MKLPFGMSRGPSRVDEIRELRGLRMLRLTLRSDGSAVDAAVEALVEDLSKLTSTGSSDRDLVRRRQERKLYENGQQKRNPYSGVASANRKRDEGTQAAVNQVVAYLAAAGRTAGFDVARSGDAGRMTFRVDC